MKTMKGYVYTFTGGAADLARVAREHFGEKVWHWAADPSHLDIKSGFPKDWQEQGAVFNRKGEMRWYREGEKYRALILTESPITTLPPLGEGWKIEEQRLLLQNLQEAKVHPQFSQYPTGKTKGRIVACLYKKQGVTVYLSLRMFEEE